MPGMTLEEERPRPRRSVWLIAGAAACAVVGLAIGGAYALGGTNPVAGAGPSKSASPAAKKLTIAGDFTLQLTEFAWDKNPPTCWGRNGYDDIRQGAQVVITDSTGATVGVGQLSAGEPSVVSDRATKCVLRWQVPDIPDGSDFYAVEVSHRGKVQYSRAEVVGPIRLGFNG